MAPDPARLTDQLPRLRGRLHAWAFWVALAGAVVLAIMAATARARIAALVYGCGLCGLFGASATYHRWRGHPRWKPLLRRVDHAMIFVFIAASYTPVALLVLRSPLAVVVLALAWGGALLGVLFSLVWIDAPRALVALCYLAQGWVVVIALPQFLSRAGVPPVTLVLTGGLLYSLGAAVYASRKPDPWPRTFGFHEVFHLLVVIAAIAHFVAMAGWVIPRGAGG